MSKQKNSNVRPLLSITFPQGFRISKNIGHRTSRSGGKRPLNGTSKVNRQTDRQTDKPTNIWTFRLIESIGPEGRCFENFIIKQSNNGNIHTRRQRIYKAIQSLVFSSIPANYSLISLFNLSLKLWFNPTFSCS